MAMSLWVPIFGWCCHWLLLGRCQEATYGQTGTLQKHSPKKLSSPNFIAFHTTSGVLYLPKMGGQKSGGPCHGTMSMAIGAIGIENHYQKNMLSMTGGMKSL